ncbi:DUF4394 domain-containing protein [Rubrobacter indicoceani]|uniref:DUF4394 domain-containing protein n=1 Tax=Rubrobacter indicoceani TaxID=2051957 RepID=UPI000E5B9D48|nr:DUF4394 domain-containing protein [Rubrobacter indicoceani]
MQDTSGTLGAETTGGVGKAMKLFLLGGATFGMMTFGAVGAHAQTADSVYGLTDAGELVAFDPSSPATVNATVPVTGDASGDTILGMDFRPATGELYAIGASSTVYTVDPATGVATTVGTTDPALEGSVLGFDFNPTADAIRVVTDAGQNLRLTDLDSELETTVDGALAYDESDENAGEQPAVVGAGYTNNVPDAEDTMLYDLDLATGDLVQQDANPGVLSTVGSVGVPFTANTGFDISPDGAAYATLQPGEGQASSLYTIDLDSGAASEVGAIGGGLVVTGFAIPAGDAGMMTTGGAETALPDTGGASAAAVAGAGLLAAGAATMLVLRVRRPDAR